MDSFCFDECETQVNLLLEKPIWNSRPHESIGTRIQMHCLHFTWLCLMSSAGAPYEFLYKVETPVF